MVVDSVAEGLEVVALVVAVGLEEVGLEVVVSVVAAVVVVAGLVVGVLVAGAPGGLAVTILPWQEPGHIVWENLLL